MRSGRRKLRGNLYVGRGREVLLKAREGFDLMEKTEDKDGKRPRLKPGLSTEGGELEADDPAWRQGSSTKKWRRKSEESVTALRGVAGCDKCH